MAGFRKPELPREQLLLWPTKLDQAVPADHPVRHVLFVMQSEAFRATLEDMARKYHLLEGKPPYHPRDLAALYLYGMLIRVRSSRQLERACHERVDVMWLMSRQTPDHFTIAQFVADHSKELRGLFKDLLRVAARAGLVPLEHVCTDGTKIEADAGKKSVHRETTLARELAALDEQVAAMEAQWAANEKSESLLGQKELAWDPSAASDRQKMARLKRQQERLAKAVAAITRRREENCDGPAPKAIASASDPDSRVMKDKEGRSKPNYNAQLSVDAHAGVIVANDVNDRAEDGGQLAPMLGQVKDNCGRLPQQASADSQYNVGPDLAAVEEMGVDAYLPDSGQQKPVDPLSPQGQAVAALESGAALTAEQWEQLPRDKDKDKGGRITKECFVYDEAKDAYRCPMGQWLTFAGTAHKARRWGVSRGRQYRAAAGICASCARAGSCCQKPKAGRSITHDQYEAHRRRMRQKMRSEAGRQRYALRGQTVEPRIGYVKHDLGVRRFLRRGLELARTAWTMLCTAANLGVLLRHWPQVAKVL